MKGLWVDDTRPLPSDLEGTFDVATSFHQAIQMLENTNYDILSLDHDLASFYGNKEMTGMDIVWWLVNQKHDGKHTPSEIHVHSANIIGAKNMKETIYKYLRGNNEN